MKELNIFDLRLVFYVKNYLYGQSPRSKIDHPGIDRDYTGKLKNEDSKN